MKMRQQTVIQGEGSLRGGAGGGPLLPSRKNIGGYSGGPNFSRAFLFSGGYAGGSNFSREFLFSGGNSGGSNSGRRWPKKCRLYGIIMLLRYVASIRAATPVFQ
eukprot:55716-Amphidinium_carterae.1